MTQIKNHKWNAVLLSDYFDFEKGNQTNMGALQIGDIPLVSAKKCDNGYKSFVAVNGKQLYKGHCITLNNDGDGGAGLAYYQPTRMALDSHVTALFPKEPMSKYTMLFIAKSISAQRFLFGHARSINSSRLRIFKIMLPVDENGFPDYVYMEAYMRAIEKRLLLQYRAYLTDVCESNLTGGKIEKASWKAFFLNEICTINSGRDIYERERVSGDTPYLTATAEQNGIGYFVGNSNETIEDGCISVNRNGSVGYAFYHPYPALYGNDTRKLIPFNKNKYVAMFLAKMITAQKDKYSYGLKMGTGRLRRQKIMLPVDKNSNPDYTYMENYMKALEYQLKTRYIDYLLQANTNNP